MVVPTVGLVYFSLIDGDNHCIFQVGWDVLLDTNLDDELVQLLLKQRPSFFEDLSKDVVNAGGFVVFLAH